AGDRRQACARDAPAVLAGWSRRRSLASASGAACPVPLNGLSTRTRVLPAGERCNYAAGGAKDRGHAWIDQEGNAMARVLVLYYSSWGHMEKMAEAAAEGAREAGAEVTVKRVPELVPEAVAKAAHY